jgi:hypothetical protein
LAGGSGNGEMQRHSIGVSDETKCIHTSGKTGKWFPTSSEQFMHVIPLSFVAASCRACI